MVKLSVLTILLSILPIGCCPNEQGQHQTRPQSTVAVQKTESKQLGAVPDATVLILKLEQLLKTPESYRSKDVVLEGVYGGACGDGDYFFKDKFDMIEFTLDQGIAIEKLKVGTPLRLYGKVKVRMSEAKEANVSIDGKGVEY